MAEIKKVKWAWPKYVMQREDNLWCLRVTEWIRKGTEERADTNIIQQI